MVRDSKETKSCELLEAKLLIPVQAWSADTGDIIVPVAIRSGSGSQQKEVQPVTKSPHRCDECPVETGSPPLCQLSHMEWQRDNIWKE